MDKARQESSSFLQCSVAWAMRSLNIIVFSAASWNQVTLWYIGASGDKSPRKQSASDEDIL